MSQKKPFVIIPLDLGQSVPLALNYAGQGRPVKMYILPNGAKDGGKSYAVEIELQDLRSGQFVTIISQITHRMFQDAFVEMEKSFEPQFPTKTKSTMVELVAELEEIHKKSATEGFRLSLEQVIAEAKAGEFHDYKNKKYAEGKSVLVGYLRALHLEALALRVIDGEFDENPDELDLEEMRKTTPKEMWPMLGLNPKEGMN